MLTAGGITSEELGLAARNHGMPLEALRYDLTPVGLHYLLIHYDIPVVDPETFVLTVDGAVESVVDIDLQWIQRLPARTEVVTMECAGNGRARIDPRPISQPWLHEAVGTAAWTGVPVSELLRTAGVDDEAVEVVFTGLDVGLEGELVQAYQRSLALDELSRPEVMVAYAMNGSPLLPQHGAPLRLIVPGWYGMTSVKWLERMTVVKEPFAGYQQTHAYRWRRHDEEEGRPVTRIQPRSLIEPPGIPDFLTRRRLLEAGTVEIRGRAWSGFGAVESVEVSVDGGGTWQEATCGEPVGAYGWCGWQWEWDAQPGRYALCCRATDATGRSQPMEAEWNLGGYEVNAVHRIDVEVLDVLRIED